MTQTNELFGKDRAGLMERMGRLLGSTTYRDQDSGGGTPFSARKLTSEAKLLLSIKFAQAYPGDVGPWVVYSIALRLDDRQREIVTWLADKLAIGTGPAGQRNKARMLPIAMASYRLAVHGAEVTPPAAGNARDFTLLANIGAGWLWTKADCVLSRVEDGEETLARPEVFKGLAVNG